MKYIFIIYLFGVISIKNFTYIFYQTLNTLIKNASIVAFVLLALRHSRLTTEVLTPSDYK